MVGTFALAAGLLLAGWGWAVVLLRQQGRAGFWPAVLLSLGCSGFWFFAMACLGVTWRPWFAGLPGGVGLALAVAKTRLLCRLIKANLGPTVLGAVLLPVLSSLPAWGWDFRYQWGLKAQVFAAFGGHNFSWLSQESVSFANPAYPPLWPDTLAMPMFFGFSVTSSAAILSALLRLGLASLCWDLAPNRGRGLAAALGFFSPLLFRPSFSGYAEPLLAFLLGCAAASLKQSTPSLAWLAFTLLPLATGEGLLWLLALGAASFLKGQKPPVKLFLLALVPSLFRYLSIGQLVPQGWPSKLPPVLDRLCQFPQAFLAAGSETFVTTFWVLAAVVLAWKKTPLALATVIFFIGLLGVYIAGPHPLVWWLANSWARVFSVPLPLLLVATLEPGSPRAAVPNGVRDGANA